MSMLPPSWLDPYTPAQGNQQYNHSGNRDHTNNQLTVRSNSNTVIYENDDKGNRSSSNVVLGCQALLGTLQVSLQGLQPKNGPARPALVMLCNASPPRQLGKHDTTRGRTLHKLGSAQAGTAMAFLRALRDLAACTGQQLKLSAFVPIPS